jgi:hypothetical protein
VSADTRTSSRAHLCRVLVRVVLAAAAALHAAGCGKKGPPLPPVRILPRPAQNVHVRQLGADVLLDATVSPGRTDDTPLGPEARVQILRMSPSATLKTSGVSTRYLMTVFQKQAAVVASVAVAGHIVYRDHPVSGAAGPAGAGTPQAPPPRYIYAVRVADGHGQISTLSATQEIQLLAPPAAPLRLKVGTAEGEVRLAWDSGATETKGELFNVYRRAAAQAEEPLVPLNPAPLSEPAYVDNRFTYGETYRYAVRALHQPPPPLRESVSSDEVEVRPLDVYPPKTPTGLAAAVEGQSIKLYWFPNSEPDLKGYRVYRREAQTGFQSIGEVDAAETSFADTTAVRGVRYYYEVTALDGATPPNESARSAEVSESVSADTVAAPGGMGRRR